MTTGLFTSLLPQIKSGSFKALARCISLVENQVAGFEDFMQTLPSSSVPVVGITGPPGAGKSTLVDALTGYYISQNKRVGVICVDPSSPFNLGALLGDRIRMSSWYNHPDVFIRSLATRGSLGGLHPEILEIIDVMKQFPFDAIIVETVGVGQSEVEIAGLADCTVVVLVPESGDDIQTMKAGLMEIADVFVINKADRPGADQVQKFLRSFSNEIPVIKTVAAQNEGVDSLADAIKSELSIGNRGVRKNWLLAEKAWHLLVKKRTKDLDKNDLKKELDAAILHADFNLYRFVENL